MGWEPEKLGRTLLIDVYDAADHKKRYAIRPEMRVRRANGEVYLESIPSTYFVTGSRDVLVFDAVEFVDRVGNPRLETGGDLAMTNSGDGAVRA